ncbi:FtsX-like permease family protein [Actinomadura formosensis]|uniref:FtsX-like permease family protein n=2 Tax=Actinomadura formosensis TaxID=60706 RepID=UPI003D938738
MNRYRFALRLARQDAQRAKGRTALILGMIGLPVAAVVALAVLWRTAGAAEPEPAQSSSGEGAVLAMIFAMVVLEIVLLAGPAFAVDVRRRRRDLALVAAAGGSGRHLRATVLASGLLLGGAAAVGGAALGIASASIVNRATGGDAPSLAVPWLAVALTMLFGAGSGLLAALVPAAQAARMDVVAALAGRREPPGPARRGWPIAGGMLVLAGLTLSVWGTRQWRELGAAAGAALVIIGLVLACPWLVGTTGRLAPLLPMPLRFAVRDAARNRSRTAPAVAAIMAAVAGITALAIGGASDFRQRQIEYQPKLPMGSALVRPPLDRADAVGQAVWRALPGVPVRTLKALPGPGTACPPGDTAQCPGVEFAGGSELYDGSVVMDNVVGGPREAAMLLGAEDPAVTSALNAGKVVLFGVRPPAEGKVTATVFYWANEEQRTIRTIKDLPAVAASGDSPVRTIVPPAVAERIGLPVRTEAFGIDRADHRVTEAEQARLDRVLDSFSKDEGAVYVERGFTKSFDEITLALGAVAAILVFGGALIATGLASADARPDLATLGAVGAGPRARRLLTMGRAGFIAVLGCWLGIAGGLVPGIAVTRPLTAQVEEFGAPQHGTIIDIPWALLAAIAVGLPLLAALVAGAFTRSNLPMTRRNPT